MHASGKYVAPAPEGASGAGDAELGSGPGPAAAGAPGRALGSDAASAPFPGSASGSDGSMTASYGTVRQGDDDPDPVMMGKGLAAASPHGHGHGESSPFSPVVPVLKATKSRRGDGFACAQDGSDCGCHADHHDALLDDHHYIVKALVSLAFGAVFGLALQKSGMYRAELIRGQLGFKNNLMLQVFLSASATSTLTMMIMYYTDRTAHVVGRTGSEYHTPTQGLPVTAVGTALLGAGMAVAGVCPGTVFAAVGSGSAQSLLSLAGGVVGAGLYGLLVADTKVWQAFKRWGIPTERFRTAFSLLGTTRAKMAPVMAGLMYAGAYGASLLPATMSFPPAGIPATSNPLAAYTWSPYLAGAVIGGLQLPLTALLGRNVGCSTSFAVTASNIVNGLGYHGSSYLNKFRSDWKTGMWQVLFVSGAIAGAALGTYASVSMLPVPGAGTAGSLVDWYRKPIGVSPLASFAGAAMAVFGARIAGGCTSGHGISGVGHMGLSSYAGVAAMFAGGCSVAFAFYR